MNDDLKKKARKWVESQQNVSPCACLGNCEDCGWHLCRGCVCDLIDLAYREGQRSIPVDNYEYTAGILAERKRCADIARSHIKDLQPFVITGGGNPATGITLSTSIAEEIEKGEITRKVVSENADGSVRFIESKFDGQDPAPL